MNRAIVRLIQESLREAGLDPGPTDGLLGPRTHGAVGKALQGRAADLPEAWGDWSNRRRCIAWLQLIARDAGLDPGPIDGLWGPRTDVAADGLLHQAAHGTPPPPWRDLEPPESSSRWPLDRGDELMHFYGEVGQNLVRLQVPFRHRLAWDLQTGITSFFCHEKVHDSLARVLDRVLDHYGEQRLAELRLDRFGGCLNVRRKRGGTSWSTHAWGIAVDYDPDRNKLDWGRDRAAFARPDYDLWWRLWEEEGWISLGRLRNFDWMHVQAARLP
jgi:hypothetical protein